MVVMIEGRGGTGESKLAEHFLDNVMEKQTLLRYEHKTEDLSMSSSSRSHNDFLPILMGWESLTNPAQCPLLPSPSESTVS